MPFLTCFLLYNTFSKNAISYTVKNKAQFLKSSFVFLAAHFFDDTINVLKIPASLIYSILCTESGLP